MAIENLHAWRITEERYSRLGALCVFFFKENHLKLWGFVPTCSSSFQSISYRVGMYNARNILTPNKITSERLELTGWKHRTVNIKKDFMRALRDAKGRALFRFENRLAL